MKKIAVMIVILIVSLTIGVTKASIIIDEKPQSFNTLNIDDLTYKNSTIVMNGDSVINIFYHDGIGWDDWYFNNHLFPTVKFNIVATGNSTINLNTYFLDVFDFVLVDMEEENWHVLSPGETFSSCSNGLLTTQMTFFRDYKLALTFDPLIGYIALEDNATLFFVPEPTTLILLGGSCLFLIRKKRN
jgi:hypothetical protein